MDQAKEATDRGLAEEHVARDPMTQFAVWFQQALDTGVPEANAMTLATATRDGKPSARMVLLKDHDADGFVFYTNYASRKGGELEENPHAALVFYWREVQRQVRVTGRVARLSRLESEQYFHTRPRGSQIGAWASRQSEVIPRRDALDRRFQELEQRFDDGPIPLPAAWGGLRVRPDAVEFWQGRTNRLHDRLLYTRQADGTWRVERLSP